MSIQLNLSQDEVDFINTILFNSTMQVGTLEHINAKVLAKKISMQAHGYDRNALGGGWLE